MHSKLKRTVMVLFNICGKGGILLRAWAVALSRSLKPCGFNISTPGKLTFSRPLSWRALRIPYSFCTK